MRASLISISGLAAMVLAASASPLQAQSDGSRPQYGSWGYDTAGADLSTKPGDDFFRYANGAWIDHTSIPADKPSYSLRLGHERHHRGPSARPHGGRGCPGAESPQRPRGQGRRILQVVHGRGARRGTRRRRRSRPSSTRSARPSHPRRRSRRSWARTNCGLRGLAVQRRHRRRPQGPEALRRLPRARAVSACPTATTTSSPSSRRRRPSTRPTSRSCWTLVGWPEPAERAKDVVAFETQDRRGELAQGASSATPTRPTIPMTLAELAKPAPGFALDVASWRAPGWPRRHG